MVADTRPVLLLVRMALVMALSSLSISVNTLLISIPVFEASSSTVMSATALSTVGASSIFNMVIVTVAASLVREPGSVTVKLYVSAP